MNKVFKTISAAILIIGVYSYFGANCPNIAKLLVLSFWLVLLPGALLASILLKKDIRKLEAWILGAGIGVNILPVLFTIGGIFTPDAPPVWWSILGIVSVANLFGIKRVLSQPLSDTPSIPIPLFPILIICFTFFAFLLFRYFVRDAAHGNYYFTIFFGGDEPYHSGYIVNFERYTTLYDFHDGGTRMYYHDFTHRMLAGLHFFSGGNIYDAYWFFLTGFDTVILVSWIWLIAKKITGDTLVAWIAAIGFFFFPTPSGMFLILVSPSFRLGIIEAFLCLYLATEISLTFEPSLETGSGQASARLRTTLSWFYLAIVAFFVGWKITDLGILVPALLIVGAIEGVRKQRWHLFVLTLIGALIGGAYAIVALSPANTMAGEIIVGRHLWPIAYLLNQYFSMHLYPVMPLSHLNPTGVLVFALLLLPYLIAKLAFSGRYFMSLLVLPALRNRRFAFPNLFVLIISTVFIGYLFCNFVSRKYYYYGDAYQLIFADAIALLTLGIVTAEAWRIFQSRVKKTRKERYILAMVVIGLGIELYNAVNYHMLQYRSIIVSLPISLVDALDSASTHLPPDALVATRRFNLYPNHAKAGLDIENKEGGDWNFEFYATGLRSRIIMEGPADPLPAAVATLKPDPYYCSGPNPELAEVFWRKSAWLDSLYTSTSAEHAQAALDSLRATHVLIDHTIDQHIAEGVARRCDTVYDSRPITLLRKR